MNSEFIRKFKFFLLFFEPKKQVYKLKSVNSPFKVNICEDLKCILCHCQLDSSTHIKTQFPGSHPTDIGPGMAAKRRLFNIFKRG